jgi:peptidoglycan/xylan/chitin deacetylase (PgdA/CDA1 family)
VVESEVTRAHEILADILGKAPTAFAYPNGNADPRSARALARLGYEAAFLFDHRIGRFPPADPHRISRLRVASSIRADRFRIIVSGLHPSLHRLLGRL